MADDNGDSKARQQTLAKAKKEDKATVENPSAKIERPQEGGSFASYVHNLAGQTTLPDLVDNNDLFFRILFDNCSDAILVIDGQRISAANPAAEKLTGFSIEELLAMELKKLFKKELIVRKDGIKIEATKKNVNFGGRQLLILYDGRFTALEKASYDIRGLLAGSMDVIVKLDDKGNILDLLNAQNFLGYQKGELVGKKLKEFAGRGFSNKISSILKKINQQSSGTDVLARDTVKFINKGGKNIYIALSFSSSGKEILCFAKDVTENVELHEEISRSSKEYEGLVDNVSDIIFTMDKQGTINFANNQFEKQLGLRYGEVKSIVRLIHHEDLAKVMETLAKSESENKGVRDLEFRLQNAKKKWIYFSANAAPIKEEGVVVGFSSIMRNINEKKKAENETAKAKKQLDDEVNKLREVSKAKSEFVSTVSHDLRTPLTSIQGYAVLLANKMLGELTPQQLDAAGIIHKESVRLSKMIDELLDLSKLESGSITLHKRSFFLSSLEDRCSCRALADAKGLTLIWNTPDEVGEVFADPDRIAQVMVNLVSNAIKYTDRGSITINSFSKKEIVQVDVIDTGMGIPEKEYENVFETYYRISGTKKKGTGLGLKIAKDIVKLHGGDIWVAESKVGKGSKFSFTLPKTSSMPYVPEQELSQTSDSVGDREVIVIEEVVKRDETLNP
jgi:PAS domain S-box-containing protein